VSWGSVVSCAGRRVAADHRLTNSAAMAAATSTHDRRLATSSTPAPPARRPAGGRLADRGGGGDLAELDAFDLDALSARGERQRCSAGAAPLDLDALAELV
jgi:hypothetical protein